jgi:endonuclease/exonuclease/phosphatase family metal-dependent hydrolase
MPIFASPRRVLPFILALLAGGCASHHSSKETLAPAESEFRAIVVDGDTSEWPDDKAVYADEHYLYLRFTVAQEQFTLQAASRSVAVYLDCDDDAATGMKVSHDGRSLGVDMLAVFSPEGKNGVKLYACNASGERRELSTADFDLIAAPTYASSWYEMRLCRTPDHPDGLPAKGLLSPGRVRGFAALLDAHGVIAGTSDEFDAETDVVCAGGRRFTADDVPAKAPGSLRLLSWNIEMSKPTETPAPYARIISTLSPDVLLLQEWEKGDAASVEHWLSTNVGGLWHVAKAPGTMANGGGVLVASKFEVRPCADTALSCTFRNDKNADATVQTPGGPLTAGSMHLKSRGTKDSVEDRRRMSEARAINAFMAKTSKDPKSLRVVSGDMNLVGTRPPLDILRAGIDVDGSDMTPAEPMVFGDQAFYTWRDPSTPFCAGRLDWLVYSDATLHEQTSFVFDTSRLDASLLKKLKLERTDSAVCDHLPVVVDLSRR